MDDLCTSVNWLKRCATKMKKIQGVSHSEALDIVAKSYGFQNFVDAKRKIGALNVPSCGYSVELSQNWFNRAERTHGIETVTIILSTQLSELVRPHHLVGYLGGDRIIGDNCLVAMSGHYPEDNAEYAQKRLARTARALQFMDITGLRPSKSRRGYPEASFQNRPPLADHDAYWFDPISRKHVFTTEPYPGRGEADDSENRQWQNRHQFDLFRVSWGSIYGFGTEFYMSAKRDNDFDILKVVKKLNTAAPAFKLMDE